MNAMKFKTKLAAYSAATSILLGASAVLTPSLSASLKVIGVSPMFTPPTNTHSFNLEYNDIPIDSELAKKLWADKIDGIEMMSGEPTVFVANFESDDRIITVSLLYASNQCSMSSCPIRIFDNDEMIIEKMACSNITEHIVSTSKKVMAACDDVILISRDRKY